MIFLWEVLLHVSILHFVYGFNCESTNNCTQLKNKENIEKNCLEPYCSCKNSDILLCTNFNRFSELDFTQLTNSKTFQYIELRPKLMLDLDEELQLTGLTLHGRLSLYNLKSLHLAYNPFLSMKYVLFNLAILDSSFNFSDICQPANETVFGKLNIFEFRLTNVTFTRPICPYMFQDSKIEQFIITEPNGKIRF